MKKIHATWEYMKPNKNEKYQDFKFEEYYRRMLTNDKVNHIPKPVFEQWIYYFNQEYNSLNNYGWINYENIQFKICEWETSKLESVNVIEDFKEYFLDRSSYSDFDQFCCSEEDLENWIERGTWRVPPIIIDIKSLRGDIPAWAEMTPLYQLVEGHTRMGYLNSLRKISSLSKGRIASKHLIYLMQEN